MANAQIGDDSRVDDRAILGYGDGPEPTRVGDRAVIRAGSVIYHDVSAGDRFHTGHDVLVREHTRIGDDVLLGTQSIVDGRTTIGSHVSVQSAAYVPTHSTIGSNVFLGPGAVLTNDPHPIRDDSDLEGPTLEDGTSIGANATVLPGVTIGRNAFVAAGAVVTEDVPPDTLAVGAPASARPLPEKLAGPNAIE